MLVGAYANKKDNCITKSIKLFNFRNIYNLIHNYIFSYEIINQFSKLRNYFTNH